MRIGNLKPSPKLAIIAYFIYLVVFIGIWVANGVQYPHIGDNADTLLRWYVLPLVGGTVTLALITSIYGWWKPALFEPKELRAKQRFFATIGIAMVIGSLLVLFSNNLSSITPEMWLYLTIGSILVGFNEELLARGLLLVGFRAKYSEKKSWLLSTTLFSLLHLPNAFLGVGIAIIAQLIMTFIIGTVLYQFRRWSGVLFGSMFLHGLWDFSSFANRTDSPWQGVAIVIIIVIAIMGTKKLFPKQKQPTKSVAA